MCNCIEAAINQGFVIQGGNYDETKHDFVKLNQFWMPLAIRGRKGHFKKTNLTIKFCPICGEPLPSKEKE